MTASRIVVLVLLWALIPGLTEATEDVSHALFFGHSVHTAATEQEHDDSNPEHGCTGAFHQCGCHSSPSSILASDLRRLPAPETAPLARAEGPRRLSDVLSVLDHVPRA